MESPETKFVRFFKNDLVRRSASPFNVLCQKFATEIVISRRRARNAASSKTGAIVTDLSPVVGDQNLAPMQRRVWHDRGNALIAKSRDAAPSMAPYS